MQIFYKTRKLSFNSDYIHVSRPVKCQLKMTKRSGRPGTSMTENIEKIQELVLEDRR
jgi:hypothetical protein